MPFNIPMGDYPLTADALAMFSAASGRQYQDQAAQSAAEMAERQAAHRNQYALAIAQMQLQERLANAQRALQEQQMLDQALSRHQQYSLALGQDQLAQARLGVEQSRLALDQRQYSDRRTDQEAFLAKLGAYNTSGMIPGQLTYQSPSGATFTLRAEETLPGHGRAGAASSIGLDPSALRGVSELGDLYSKQANSFYTANSAGASNLNALASMLAARVLPALQLPQRSGPLAGFQLNFAGDPATNFTGTAPSGGVLPALQLPQQSLGPLTTNQLNFAGNPATNFTGTARSGVRYGLL